MNSLASTDKRCATLLFNSQYTLCYHCYLLIFYPLSSLKVLFRSNTDKQQEAAKGEDDETQGHGLLAAQAVNDPESHQDTCKGAGCQGGGVRPGPATPTSRSVLPSPRERARPHDPLLTTRTWPK